MATSRTWVLLFILAFAAAGCAGTEEQGEEPDQTVIEDTGEAAGDVAGAVGEGAQDVADEAEDMVDDERTVEIVGAAGSGVSGNADFRESGESTRIEVELDGLTAGASYTASLREGGCAAEGIEIALLGNVGGEGAASPDVTTTVPAGTIEVGQLYNVAIVDETGAVVACGELTG